MSLTFKEQALIGAVLGTLYVGSTVAVNTLIEGTRAAQEGIERLCGAETRQYVGTLRSTRNIALPQAHGTIREGTFTLKDGREVKMLDLPVITAGKYLPGMNRLEEGQTYTVTAFEGGLGGLRFIEAEKN